MNALINKNALNKVKEAHPDRPEKQIVDIITLSHQGLGVRMIGKKLNLTKDKVHRVLKKYENECAKTRLKPSRQEREVYRLEQKNEALRIKAERQAWIDELLKQNVWYSLKANGSKFIGSVIKRKVLKYLPKGARDGKRAIDLMLVHWTGSRDLDDMLEIYEITATELMDTFDEWYPLRTERVYPGTGRFAKGEECLALEIGDHLLNEIYAFDIIDREHEIKAAQKALGITF